MDAAKRAKYVAKVRKAYRDGELTDAQADALRAAGVNLDRFQPLMAGVNDLATLNPEIAAQWHPEKNGDLAPADVTAGSNRKVWWRHWCDKTQSWHEWEAKVRDASAAKLSCPYCGNRKILAGFNDLGSLFPEPSEFWHPTKNGALTPADVMAGSGRKVWWKCPRCGKQWISPVREQAHRKGCSECAARRVGQTQEAAMKAHRAHSDAASPKKC